MANVISTFRNNLAAIRGPPGRLDTKHFNNIPGDRGPNLNFEMPNVTDIIQQSQSKIYKNPSK
jgi:hypothetical protein